MKQVFRIKHYISWLSLCLILLAHGLGTGRAMAIESDKADPALRIISFASIFDVMPGVDPEDARLSLEMIMRKTMVRPDNPFKAELDFIGDFATASEKIAQKRYHFVVSMFMDYVDLNRTIALKPILVLSKTNRPVEFLVLITRNNVTLEQIVSKPKSILILEESRAGAMAKAWLDTVLWEKGLTAGSRIFSEIQYARKTSRVILPVFFGKADACVTTLSAFDLMADLNPQIKKNLTIAKQSEKLALMVLCATPFALPDDEAVLRNEARWAMDDPETLQALTIAQMQEFFLYQPDAYKPAEAIFSRYLQRVSPPKSASTTPAGGPSP
jgi:hypothetical protein